MPALTAPHKKIKSEIKAGNVLCYTVFAYFETTLKEMQIIIWQAVLESIFFGCLKSRVNQNLQHNPVTLSMTMTDCQVAPDNLSQIFGFAGNFEITKTLLARFLSCLLCLI